MHLLLFPSTTIQPQCFLLTGGAGAGLLAGRSPSCIKALDLRATINHGCREVLGSTCDPWERSVPARPFPSLGRQRKKAARKQGLPRADSFRSTRGDEEHECHSAAAPVQPGDRWRQDPDTYTPVSAGPSGAVPTAIPSNGWCWGCRVPADAPGSPCSFPAEAAAGIDPVPAATRTAEGHRLLAGAADLPMAVVLQYFSCCNETSHLSVFRTPFSDPPPPSLLLHTPRTQGSSVAEPPHQQPPLLLRCTRWERSEAEVTSPGLHAARPPLSLRLLP